MKFGTSRDGQRCIFFKWHHLLPTVMRALIREIIPTLRLYFCQAQPEPQLNLAEAELALFSFDPTTHPSVKVYCSLYNTAQWSNKYINIPISLSTPPATPSKNFLYSSKFKNILAGLELCATQCDQPQLVFPILSAIIMRQIAQRRIYRLSFTINIYHSLNIENNP